MNKMLEKITLVLSENDKVIENVSKETSTHFVDIVDSLLEFQKIVNDTLTKLILSSGDSIEPPHSEDDSSEESAPEEQISPKKRKT